MNLKYSPGFSQSLLFSREEAMRLNSPVITSEHLLLGLLHDSNVEAVKMMRQLCPDLDSIKPLIEHQLQPSDQVLNAEDLTIDEKASNILKNSVNEAYKMGASSISSIHLLLAILKEKDTEAMRILNNNGISYETIKQEVLHKTEDVKSNFDFDEEDADEVPTDSASKKNATAPRARNREDAETPFLDKFGTDITAKAQEGKIDPVIGREKEIERIAQILSRRKKNNPILIGQPGVGKTAIVEGLAQRIVEHQVPVVLFNKRILALDMAGIVAGTKYRGQFEERIQGVLNELTSHPEIILFIDEIHTIVGAGNASGSMDAANMLKPALARGEMQCIGSTTTDEYRKSIEKDGALERRFQKIMVEPTSPEETLQILHNIKERYEKHHHVTYTEEALEACVRLTDRYLSERNLPDKAIDALDEAGSRVHIINVQIPDTIKTKEQQIHDAQQEKMQAVKTQDFEKAAHLRDKEVQLQTELAEMKASWENELSKEHKTVGLSEVEETVSMMSGVPVQRLMDKESIRLKGLKENLLHHVIAQDKAIGKLVKAITRNRIGLRDPNKPIGSFLFLGPTGVGKTYLAKQLAEYMFGSADALIRIDMSEYMEKFSTSRLVGAPPGYVGYDEGGQLTEKVRRHPYSIILFDEIEKADKDIFNLLLQVMDEGRLTDGNGSTVNFKNTIIIITSNVGSRQLQEFGNGIGFQDLSENPHHNEDIIKKALNKQFAPEFINRLDDIITFEQLGKEAIGTIADLELDKLNQRMSAIGYSFQLDQKAREFLIDKGYDKKYGARPLKRAIQTYVEDGISDFLLDDKKPKENLIHITYKKGKDSLSFS